MPIRVVGGREMKIDKEVQYFVVDARDPLGATAILCMNYDDAKTVCKMKKGYAIGWFWRDTYERGFKVRGVSFWSKLKELFNG
jgi:hypothetical protein